MFFDFFSKGHITDRQEAIPIERLASDYLKLDVSYCKLSDDGSLCGLTTYADTEYQFHQGVTTKTVLLKANQVLLDSSFIQGANRSKLRGKRRFTLAHECAHQILFSMEPKSERHACRKQYQGKAYSLRDLKSKEDWNEWQANALGAALLMPPAIVQTLLQKRTEKLISYGGYFTSFDSWI